MVRLLQYVAQFVALLDVYDDTFLSIHHIITILYKNTPKRLPVSDLVFCFAVYQTDTYLSVKLLLRTAETDSR